MLASYISTMDMREHELGKRAIELDQRAAHLDARAACLWQFEQKAALVSADLDRRKEDLDCRAAELDRRDGQESTGVRDPKRCHSSGTMQMFQF